MIISTKYKGHSITITISNESDINLVLQLINKLDDIDNSSPNINDDIKLKRLLPISNTII